MKAHVGVDAGTGLVHTVTATSANVHDIDEAHNLVREDDDVVYVYVLRAELYADCQLVLGLELVMGVL